MKTIFRVTIYDPADSPVQSYCFEDRESATQFAMDFNVLMNYCPNPVYRSADVELDVVVDKTTAAILMERYRSIVATAAPAETR